MAHYPDGRTSPRFKSQQCKIFESLRLNFIWKIHFFHKLFEFLLALWFLILCHSQSSKNHQVSTIPTISFVININSFEVYQKISLGSMVPLISLTSNSNIHQIQALIPSCDRVISDSKNCWNWNFQFNLKDYIILSYIGMYVHRPGHFNIWNWIFQFNLKDYIILSYIGMYKHRPGHYSFHADLALQLAKHSKANSLLSGNIYIQSEIFFFNIVFQPKSDHNSSVSQNF